MGRPSVGEIPTVHYTLIRKVAWRIARRLAPYTEDVRDLVQVGVIGYLQAVRNPCYDASHPRASWFLEWRIQGEIRDYLRGQDFLSRGERTLAKRLDGAHGQLSQRLKREPTMEEVAQCVGVDVHRAAGLMRPLYLVSLEDVEELLTVTEQTADGPLSFLDAMERGFLSREFPHLPPRDWFIFAAYLSGNRLREIGKEIRLTESRCSQLLHRAASRLRVRFTERGAQTVI